MKTFLVNVFGIVVGVAMLVTIWCDVNSSPPATEAEFVVGDVVYCKVTGIEMQVVGNAVVGRVRLRYADDSGRIHSPAFRPMEITKTPKTKKGDE